MRRSTDGVGCAVSVGKGRDKLAGFLDKAVAADTARTKGLQSDIWFLRDHARDGELRELDRACHQRLSRQRLLRLTYCGAQVSRSHIDLDFFCLGTHSCGFAVTGWRWKAAA